MTRVGWLCDDPGYVGGAELTQAEFRSAAPEGVEILDCPPGGVVSGLDRYVIHNCVQYEMADLTPIGDAPHWKYLNDLWPNGDPQVKQEILAASGLIFCSPLHKQRFLLDIPDWAVFKTIPPPVDLARFRPSRQTKRNTERKGTCCIAAWQNPGKGQQALKEWSEVNDELVALYGDGPYVPVGPNLDYLGPLAYEQVPQTLWQYERFIFLPTALEPFGRCAVEAWAAGCELVVNGLVGARHYIENDPQALESAAEDFWRVVLDD